LFGSSLTALVGILPEVRKIKGKRRKNEDAEAYQRLLDLAAQADPVEGIRQGREDIPKAVYPACAALKAFRREYGISG
jgi:hypothetical protein